MLIKKHPKKDFRAVTVAMGTVMLTFWLILLNPKKEKIIEIYSAIAV